MRSRQGGFQIGKISTDRQDKKYRDNGPYRCREDYHNGKNSLLYGCYLQDRRSSRWYGRDGLDASGTGEGDYHYISRHHVFLEGQPYKYKVPRIAFVNKMDRVGADYFRVVKMMVDRLQTRPVVMQLPVGAEDNFKGIVDLISQKAIIWDESTLGAKYRIDDVPSDMKNVTREYRDKLIEAAADFDEALMEKYLEGKGATEEE